MATASAPSGLVVWQGRCLPAWVDYNGHMSEAFYVLAFGYGTDGLMAAVGLGPDYQKAAGASLYTLEGHIRYLREVPEGAALTATLQLLEFDAKRLRSYQRLFVEGESEPAATTELLCLHVAGDPPRSAPFPAATLEALDALRTAQQSLPRPEDAGRGIQLKR